MRKIFVTGIGTDVGKTVVSAILVESLKADYWKPIQAGTLPDTDTEKVKKLISNDTSVVHPESYKLKEPMSPHAAADIENIRIDLEKINLPQTSNTLIIEGAGGLMVPLNEKYFMIDLIKKLDAEVIVVIKNYLGSINHSVLTINALKERGIKILGLVFNGNAQPSSQNIILHHSGSPCILCIAQENRIDKGTIRKYAEDFQPI